MATIKIRVTGLRRTKDNMNKLERGMRFMPGTMRRIGKEVADYYAGAGFVSKGQVFGESWKPLSPAYQQAKLKRPPFSPRASESVWGARPMLIASGEMQRSFRYNAGNSSVFIDNTREYWKYHQSEEEPRTKLPRRPTAGINRAVTDIVKDNIRDHINRTMK